MSEPRKRRDVWEGPREGDQEPCRYCSLVPPEDGDVCVDCENMKKRLRSALGLVEVSDERWRRLIRFSRRLPQVEAEPVRVAGVVLQDDVHDKVVEDPNWAQRRFVLPGGRLRTVLRLGIGAKPLKSRGGPSKQEET